MESNIPRLETELMRWWEQEKKLASVFPPSLLQGPEFQKEKLKQYDLLAAKYGRINKPEEKLLLKVLLMEIRRLEKMLFPKWWQRMMRRLDAPPFLVHFNQKIGDPSSAGISKQTEQFKSSLEPGMKILATQSKDLKNETHPAIQNTVSKRPAEKTAKDQNWKEATGKTVSDLLPKKRSADQRGLKVS
jgi:hypothetical protein